MRVLEIADRRDDQVSRGVARAEVLTQDIRVERVHRFRRAQNRSAERVVFPEALREQLVDQIVGRVLDHFDLFEHDFLFAFDVVTD